MEDIKRALMDDLGVMMQDELRQALAGLIPPSPAAAIPPIGENPPTNNDNVGGNL